MKTKQHPLSQGQAQALVGALYGAQATYLIDEYRGLARKPYKAHSWLNATFYAAAGGKALISKVHFDGEPERETQIRFL